MLARWLYTLVYALLTPVFWWRLDWRTRKMPGNSGRAWERWGWYTHSKTPVYYWLHTASVGEYMAAKPLIARLLADHPERRLLITTMTATGSERVRQEWGEQVAHVYLPYDLPGPLRRLLRHFQPRQLLILETELWPNMVHYAYRAGLPVLVLNARLSAASAAGYQRILPLVRPLLREVSLVAAQANADGERFLELGLPPQALAITGSLKYDLSITPTVKAEADALRKRWGTRPVFIAASTHAGEDEQVLKAFRVLRDTHADLLLVLVPRHPERFDTVAELVYGQGWTLSRHGRADPVTSQTDVVLGDTMGEMLRLLGAADVAFIGGSLEPVGGHNMLEAVAMEVPVISGPHVFNFKPVADMLEAADALQLVSSPVGLAQAVDHMLSHPEAREAQVARGQTVLAANRGALERMLSHIRHFEP